MIRRILVAVAVVLSWPAIGAAQNETGISTVPGAVFGQLNTAHGSVVEGLAVEGDIALYVTHGHQGPVVKRVHRPSGNVTVAAGNFFETGSIDGEGGDPRDDLGDGLPATTATLNRPLDVEMDSAGDIYIADTDNRRIRRVDAITGIITTVAGGGPQGSLGDGGPATSASLWPISIALDADGNLFIADIAWERVRRVDLVTGIITTAAGSGQLGFSGDGGPATAARMAGPMGVAVDGDGNLFISDRFNHRVRRVDAATGIITTAAGSGADQYTGDCVAATSSGLRFPGGLAVDSQGNVFISDPGDNRIRRIDATTGLITTVAGTGMQTGSIDGEGGDPSDDLGDDGLATQATLFHPADIELGSDGILYVADRNNFRIRQIDLGADTTAFDPFVSLAPPLLWPPNHRMVEIQVQAGAGACFAGSAVLLSVVSSEPDNAPGAGDGNTWDDIQDADAGSQDLTFELRAERDASGGGRVYTATYSITDAVGNIGEAIATIPVPHDLGGLTDPMQLSVAESAAGTLLTWAEVEWAISYSVVRGTTGDLRETGQVIDLGHLVCIEADSTDLTTAGFEDPGMPEPGAAFFYLASYDDGWSKSGFGADDVTKPRQRASGGCPGS